MHLDGSSIHENLFLLFILAQEVAAIISAIYAIKKNSMSEMFSGRPHHSTNAPQILRKL